MKKLYSLNILLLITTLCLAQTSKYGKITEEQWKIDKCYFDSTSNILILFDVGNISIKAKEEIKNKDPDCDLKEDFFTMSIERHLRFKILTNNKINSDFIKIDLYRINGINDKLVSFKGISQTRIKNKVDKNKIKSKDLTKSKNEVDKSTMTLQLNDIKVGSIIDIKYQIQRKIISIIPPWNFINLYPNLYSEINISLPDFIIVEKTYDKKYEMNYDFYNTSNFCGVSYKVNNGWKYKKYEYYDIVETYSQRNLISIYESNELNMLKYTVNRINFNSVSYK